MGKRNNFIIPGWMTYDMLMAEARKAEAHMNHTSKERTKKKMYKKAQAYKNEMTIRFGVIEDILEKNNINEFPSFLYKDNVNIVPALPLDEHPQIWSGKDYGKPNQSTIRRVVSSLASACGITL